MDKKQFLIILESSLLKFDEVEDERIFDYLSEKDIKFIKIGIKLCEYLKSIKLQEA